MLLQTVDKTMAPTFEPGTKSVFVKRQTSLKTKLTKRFRELREQKKQTITDSQTQGSFDPPKTIRIDVTVDYQEIEGETVMVLRDLHDFDWETPPSKQN